ncbi:MAG TPA: hypothetical protein DCG79_00630 [Clostridiales bacterium]|nr:hypothetical protein [Clostridiales bacterium]
MNELRYADEVKKSSAYKSIAADIDRGEFSHAYFIQSEDKDAVDTLFTLIAMKAYCPNGGCGECAECHKVLVRSKPDVKYLAEGKENFTVAEMSEVTEDAGMTAFEGGRKLYFFKNFENLADAPQNKLLKTLEEPFDKVHFILSAASVATVLPTVLSRVKQVPLGAFPTESVKAALIKDGVPQDRAERGAGLSQGNLTRAREFAVDEDFSRHVTEVTDVLTELKGSADVYRFVKEGIFSKDRIERTLSMFELVFHCVMSAHLGLPVALSEKTEAISAIAEMYGVAAVGEALNVILTCRARLKANCNATNVADYLLLKLAEVKYKCRS